MIVTRLVFLTLTNIVSISLTLMSLLARRSFRAVSRSSRQLHSATPYRTYLSEQETLQHHAAGPYLPSISVLIILTLPSVTETSDLWRKIR